MTSPTLRAIAGGTVALLAMAACWRNDLPTAVSPGQPLSPLPAATDIAPAPARSERACAVLTVHLKNKRQDGASVSPVAGANCTSGLRIVLANTVQYDDVLNVLRAPIVLENGGRRTLSAARARVRLG